MDHTARSYITLAAALGAQPVEFIVRPCPSGRGFTLEFMGYLPTPRNVKRYAPQYFASHRAAVGYATRTVEGD